MKKTHRVSQVSIPREPPAPKRGEYRRKLLRLRADLNRDIEDGGRDTPASASLVRSLVDILIEKAS